MSDNFNKSPYHTLVDNMAAVAFKAYLERREKLIIDQLVELFASGELIFVEENPVLVKSQFGETFEIKQSLKIKVNKNE